MSAAPLEVLSRPFAVEPVTRLMLPDGIFDNAIFNLQIACHVTNTSSSDLTDVTVYLESTSDPGIVVSARTHHFPVVPAGAVVLVKWDANFQNATPGKRWVGIVAKGAGFSAQRSLQQIFISQTRYDQSSNTFTCTVEEGTLTVGGLKGIPPAGVWRGGGTGHGEPGHECECPPDGPYVPTGVTTVWTPDPGFPGTHGDLPFSDPWWKVLAIIVLIVAAIVGIIAAASGLGVFTVAGTFEETDPSVSCCIPPPDVSPTVAGVASAVAAVALGVALSDAADPMWRGQGATPPAAGEVTIGEKVVAAWDLPKAPDAGQPYTADVEWTYTRTTTGASYTHSVTETQTNVHLCDGVTVTTPQTVGPWDQIWVRAQFQRPDQSLFSGAEAYSLCVFRSPGGLYFVEDLTDDGLGFDPAANDGIYAGDLHLEEIYRILAQHGQDAYGTWRVYVYAQDVNLTRPGTPPEVAAQTIGGFVVASALQLTFDPTLPCPLTATASVEVVAS